jgi:chlorobactene glucosyltransferase
VDAQAGTLITLLWTLPWILFAVTAALRIKEPPALKAGVDPSAPSPHVTVIVPARNESLNIETSVTSILSSAYPSFDLIVLDDRSTDETAELARQAASAVPGGADRLSIRTGAPLPEGWFGKPWACHQAAEGARGEVLLFTDADTSHDPTVLGRSISDLQASEAAGLTLIGRQLMGSFWERVVQPHVFFAIGWRYGNLRKLYDPGLEGPDRWREAIANGQFILIRRDAYDAIGGHEAIRGEVVEDLRLAQEVVKSGRRLAMRDAQDVFATRMYRSFADLAEGWTKNLWTGGRQAFGRRGARPLIFAAVLLILGFWVMPVALLAAGVAPLWAGATVAISVVFWTGVMSRFGAPAIYGWTYPLGALVLAGLLARSGLRGGRIEWKGRLYGTPAPPT